MQRFEAVIREDRLALVTQTLASWKVTDFIVIPVDHRTANESLSADDTKWPSVARVAPGEVQIIFFVDDSSALDVFRALIDSAESGKISRIPV